MDSTVVEYRHSYPLDPQDIVRVFDASGIRRPTADIARIARMFAGPHLLFLHGTKRG